MSRSFAMCVRAAEATWTAHETAITGLTDAAGTNLGGQLLRIDSLATQKFIEATTNGLGLSNTRNYVIGLNDRAAERDFVWADDTGTVVWRGTAPATGGVSPNCGYTNWGAGDPNNANQPDGSATEEDCSFILNSLATDPTFTPNPRWGWADYQCGGTLLAAHALAQFPLANLATVNAETDYTCVEYSNTVATGTTNLICQAYATLGWDAHRAAAQAAGADLMRIDSATKQSFVEITYNVGSSYAIGFNSKGANADEYFWLDETTSLIWKGGPAASGGSAQNGAYTNFITASDPGGTAAENCGIIFANSNYEWADAPCTGFNLVGLYEFSSGATCANVAASCTLYQAGQGAGAVSDSVVTTGLTVTGNVLDNDINGGALEVNSFQVQGEPVQTAPDTFTDASIGTLTMNRDGSYTFTRVATYSGPFIFTYTIQTKTRMRGRRLNTVGTVTLSFNLGGANGDPHFLRWGQNHHDSFHGECDLVLSSSKKKAIDIHLRTKIRKDYSYIYKMGIRVGTHILEVTQTHLIIDGQNITSHACDEPSDNAAFPITISGYETTAPMRNLVDSSSKRIRQIMIEKTGEKEYKINIGNGSSLDVSITGIFINVNVKGGEDDFKDSVGLMGRYGTGEMLDRQGKPMDPKDVNAYGMEWQVKHSLGDPKVFSQLEGPQWPESQCVMPQWTNPMKKKSKKRRRKKNLQTVTNTAMENAKEEGEEALRGAAKMACAGAIDFDLCVQDVILTGEIGLAKSFM